MAICYRHILQIGIIKESLLITDSWNNISIHRSAVCQEQNKNRRVQVLELYRRWGRGPRNRLGEAGFKPPYAAVVKSHGSER